MPIKLFERNATFLAARNSAAEIRWKIWKYRKGRQNMHSCTLFDVCLTSTSNSVLSCGIFPPFWSQSQLFQLNHKQNTWRSKLCFLVITVVDLPLTDFCSPDLMQRTDGRYVLCTLVHRAGSRVCGGASRCFSKVWSLHESSDGMSGAWPHLSGIRAIWWPT